MSCLIIAGEKSGEEHCLSFFSKLRKQLPTTDFFGVGGDELQAAGLTLIYHIQNFSSWGITEVVAKIPFYYKAFDKLLDEVDKRDCKVAILIDFQDFNFRMAKKLKKKGVKVLYYVAPQAWAWRPGRAKVLGQNIHTLFALLPFEKKWFMDRGVEKVISIPHPLLEYFQKESSNKQLTFKKWGNFKDRNPRILFLPGSRNFEVRSQLPLFIKVLEILNGKTQISSKIVTTSSVNSENYRDIENIFDEVLDSTRLSDALDWADICVASSGTVTLQTALFGVPTIVCYQASVFTAYLFYYFIKYKGFASLANIVHEKEVFPELLQANLTEFNIAERLLFWLNNKNEYDNLAEELRDTKEMISGEKIVVSDYIGQIIKEFGAV